MNKVRFEDNSFLGKIRFEHKLGCVLPSVVTIVGVLVYMNRDSL
jgi:hypothetical protein